jgi:hypothetical protein
MDGWIHIKEVMADLEQVGEDGNLHTFSISFVRNNDSKHGPKGSIKHVARASKFTKPHRKIEQGLAPSWTFKEYNSIPIQDLEQDQLLTPKFTHIIEYNGQKVRHYGS